MEDVFQTFNGINGILLRLDKDVHKALRCLNVVCNTKLKFMKRTKDLKFGEIVIPEGCMKLSDEEKTELLNYLHKLDVTNRSDGPVVKVSRAPGSLLTFHLNRTWLFRCTIRKVQNDGNLYGCSNSCHSTPPAVAINCVSTEEKTDQTSLTSLRLWVVGRHVQRLLEANGYKVFSRFEYSRTLEEFLRGNAECEQKEATPRQPIVDHVISKVQSYLCASPSEGRHISVVRPDLENGSDCDAKYNSSQSLVVDLKKIIKANDLTTRSDGFDSNLKTVAVVADGKLTAVMQETVLLAEWLESKPCRHCLHILAHQAAFRHQQIELILAAAYQPKICQSRLLVGPTCAIGAEQDRAQNSAQVFYQRRYAQIKEASEIRNRSFSSAQDPCGQVEQLTAASIKLDLLGNTSHNSLHVDVSSTEQAAESRQGVFVLYNSARLAGLLSQFNQDVKRGMYPPLPPVEDIDFSLLREEEDWEMLFLYIAAFPDLVQQSVEVVIPEMGKSTSRIHIHKVTNFVVSFAKCVSAHYSRYHVLTGGEKHLLPLMYARLYLLKSAHQVLANCLRLIEVEAPDCL